MTSGFERFPFLWVMPSDAFNKLGVMDWEALWNPYSVVSDVIRAGDVVLVMSDRRAYYRVMTPRGVVGYVSKYFINERNGRRID